MKYIYLSFLFLFPVLKSQNYIVADPYYLINYELKQFNNIEPFHSTSFRPFYLPKDKSLSISFINEIYINNNASNQENMDLRYLGKGIGSFRSLAISGYSKYFAFSIEPYQLNHNYIGTKTYFRPISYKFLNDTKTPNNIKEVGLRKADIYFHFNGFGFGLTKDNMWWGPGIQGSLAMTNNTTGFDNLMIGTIKELRYKNIGIMGRYTFSELNNKEDWEAIYYTSLAAQITFYSKQIFTFGFSRNYLTGGIDVGVPWTKKDAQNIIFEDVLITNLQKLDYTIAGHDPWDQTISIWTDILFPSNKMKIYLEIGFNDNRFNLWDFVVHPDHSMASIIGFRKYGLLNNKNLIFGFEYINLIQGRHHIFRATPNWYSRQHYNDFSFDGRRWGSHSGSDSDDLLIFMGLITDKWAFIPSVNFERHGVTTYRPPEIKSEFKIDSRYKINNYEFGIIYENQFEAHIGFPPDRYFTDEITGKRRTNTLIIKLIKYLY